MIPGTLMRTSLRNPSPPELNAVLDHHLWRLLDLIQCQKHNSSKVIHPLWMEMERCPQDTLDISTLTLQWDYVIKHQGLGMGQQEQRKDPVLQWVSTLLRSHLIQCVKSYFTICVNLTFSMFHFDLDQRSILAWYLNLSHPTSYCSPLNIMAHLQYLMSYLTICVNWTLWRHSFDLHRGPEGSKVKYDNDIIKISHTDSWIFKII